jgi:hypothetical protein
VVWDGLEVAAAEDGGVAGGDFGLLLVHAVSSSTAPAAAAAAVLLLIARLCNFVRPEGAGSCTIGGQSRRSRTAMVSSRPGPTPTAEIGAPIIFSSAAT